jgi:hypothetical protein
MSESSSTHEAEPEFEPRAHGSATERAERLVDRFGQRLSAAREQMAARAAASEGQPQRPSKERAEEMLDRAGEQVGRFAATVSHRLRKLAAHAREEAEDIWAEAQSKRHDSGTTSHG